ncbi:GNAT family N-acetyltransferase [Paenibacillus sp. D2_2]|uniref:GNAT family N-acetyltransferase n=1 Tax=Paenibacillus sp. D2_2 TaxID=3073092 RepID=UPI002814B2F2|nr:GNAT family N-acetyltransferase [Paenibacillus sp. D2_2]WMT39117.1 GNAT family N-acetyltransferase [Paenibacillus sp. D2_2]
MKTYNDLTEVKSLLAECMWPNEERISRELDKYLTDDSRGLYGEIIHNQLAGLIGIVPYSDDVVELKHIAIKPQYRWHRLGANLIHEYMQSYHPAKMIAETDQDAVGFYSKVGFEIHSLGEQYPGVERFQCILSKDQELILKGIRI